MVQSTAAGARIRRLRERRALTQEQLAETAGVAVRTVQRAEDGVMSAETVAALATALQVPVEPLTAADQSYPQITPMLFYAEEASMDWLAEVFGLTVRMRHVTPDGRIAHAELVIGDGLIMAIGPPGRSEHGAGAIHGVGNPVHRSPPGRAQLRPDRAVRPGLRLRLPAQHEPGRPARLPQSAAWVLAAPRRRLHARNWTKRHPFDWRPLGPRRRSRSGRASVEPPTTSVAPRDPGARRRGDAARRPGLRTAQGPAHHASL